MYYIRKKDQRWAVHNNATGRSRELNEQEVQLLLSEFPNLSNHLTSSQSLTYFRNRIRSIQELP